MLKLWQNTKWSTKIALILSIIVIALVAGWFSDWIPSTILDHYRAQYDEMKKDPDTGFPSQADRINSGGMGTYITLAYWYSMAQNRTKAREVYTEALYRYGWDHPRAAEVWVDLMELTFSGSSADRNEDDAICFYWLFGQEYSEKISKSREFAPHPSFAEYEPVVAKMITRRGSRVPAPNANNEFDVRGSVFQMYKNRGARTYLLDFIKINKHFNINKVDAEAVGDDDVYKYIPDDADIRDFSISHWK